MSRFTEVAMWLGGAAALLLLSPEPLPAQQVTLPASIVKVSAEPVVIASQLRLAVDLERKALAGLEEAGELGPLDSAHRSASNAYVLIRAAREGMETIRYSKKRFPDPVLDLVFKKVDRAWNVSRTPVDHLSWGHTRSEYLTISVGALTEAIQILDQVLMLWP